MAIITGTCPHCLSENMTFNVLTQHQHPGDPTRFTVLSVCRKCQLGISTLVDMLAGNAQPFHYPGDITSKQDWYRVIGTTPEPKTIDAPKYLPGNIHRFFLQAASNLHRQDWDAAGMMCRKVLEVSAKNLAPESKGKSLYNRIEDLAATHQITPAMKDWAHAIRLDGNEAAHEEEPMTEADAKQLFSFTEVFLMYAYTMPGMLAERRREAEPGSAG